MVAEITTLWYDYWMDINVFVSYCHSNIKKVQLTCMATWLCDDYRLMTIFNNLRCMAGEPMYYREGANYACSS